VYFIGDAAQTAALVEQLRETGLNLTVMVWEGAEPLQLIDEVGASASGTIMLCTCHLPTDEFDQMFSTEFGSSPTLWGVEAYDLATIMVKAVGSGALDRPAMTEYFRTYQGNGIGRRYQWDPTGELMDMEVPVYSMGFLH
jgi:branched-chain amino acid transport system substrate-binding protein